MLCICCCKHRLRNEKCVSRLVCVNYVFAILFWMISGLGITVGSIYSVGDYGKLLNNIYVGSVMVVAFVMAIIGSIMYEETHSSEKRSGSRTFRCLSFVILLLIGITGYLMYYENSTDDVHSSSRSGWISLDQETRRDLQSNHGCCGWENERDNVALPCRTVAGGCKDFIVDDLSFRVDVLRSILRLQIASQFFALIFTCLMASSFSEYEKQNKRVTLKISTLDEEEALLAKNSEYLQEGVFKQN